MAGICAIIYFKVVQVQTDKSRWCVVLHKIKYLKISLHKHLRLSLDVNVDFTVFVF